MSAETREFDAANYLKDDATIAAYLEEAIGSGEPALVAAALGAVARARGMTEIAREAGLSRENLYRTLSADGNPELGTFLKIMRAMKLHIAVEPQSTRDHPAA